VLSKNGVDIYNEKLIRSTQGALFHFPIIRCDITSKLVELKNDGYYIVGTSLQNGKPLSTIEEHEKMVLIVGNEGSGVSQEVLDLTDVNAFIEMANFESLNVGVAAGIMMYKFRGNK
ncbi:MAG: RNA methyltransferase, partial [Erysipelotrichales bacterium]|nr:RNA methyltransferase [Erysipelotrichales bacterium]